MITIGILKNHPNENWGRKSIGFEYSYLLLLSLIYLWFRVYVVGRDGLSGEFFLNLRLASNGVEGYPQLGWIVRVYPIIFALFIFENIFYNKKNKKRMVILWVWMISYAVATMGKFDLLIPVLSWMVIRRFKYDLKISGFLYIGIFIFLGMMTLHFVRASSDYDSSIKDVISLYVYSPIVALGYTNLDIGKNWGENWFRFLYALGYTLGVSEKPVDVILDYIEVPFLTNVYTVIYPFAKDFQYTGVFIASIAYGVSLGWIYRKVIQRRNWWLGVWAILSIVVVGQFFGDLFWSNLSGQIQVVFWFSFIYFFARKEKNAS